MVPKPGEKITFTDVVAFLQDKIAKYKLPEIAQIVDDLPHTPTGKVQKNVLREQIISRLKS